MKYVVFLIMLFSSSVSFADNNALSVLHGLWEGDSHQTNPDGSVSDMKATECVYPKHDGQIAIVEGKHVLSSGVLAFGTFGVLSPLDSLVTCDAKAAPGSNYRFAIYLNNGVANQACARIDKGWQWFLFIPKTDKTPAKSIRYTIQLTETEWTEIGEISIEPKPGEETKWSQFFRMHLVKAASSCSGF